MPEYTLEYYIENKYELPVRKANFQLLVVPAPENQQKVMNFTCSCSGNLETHFSKNVFGFTLIQYYIGKPFSEFWFKLSATIHKPEINPFYVSPLSSTEEFAVMHSLDFQIDHHVFLLPTILTTLPGEAVDSFPRYTGAVRGLRLFIAIEDGDPSIA